MGSKYSWMGAVIGAVFGLILAYLVLLFLKLNWETILRANLMFISAIVGACFAFLMYFMGEIGDKIDKTITSDVGDILILFLFGGMFFLGGPLSYTIYFISHSMLGVDFTRSPFCTDEPIGLCSIFFGLFVYVILFTVAFFLCLASESLWVLFFSTPIITGIITGIFLGGCIDTKHTEFNSLATFPFSILLLIALPFALLGYYTGEPIGSSIESWIEQRRERRQRISYYKSKIKTWKREGYSVKLGKLKNLELVERKIREYESKIQRLKEIERELNSLNTQGFEKEVQLIRSKLKDPEKAELAEKEFLELKRNIEKSERMKKEIIAMIDEAISG